MLLEIVQGVRIAGEIPSGGEDNCWEFSYQLGDLERRQTQDDHVHQDIGDDHCGIQGQSLSYCGRSLV